MSYERLGQQIMFGKNEAINLTGYGLEYRKNKGVEYVKKDKMGEPS